MKHFRHLTQEINLSLISNQSQALRFTELLSRALSFYKEEIMRPVFYLFVFHVFICRLAQLEPTTHTATRCQTVGQR